MWSISKLEEKKDWDKNHYLTNVLTRYVAEGSPIHVALHHFNAISNHDKYCSSHEHENENEINVIIAEDDFEIELEFDKHIQVVKESCVISIPSGTSHAANVKKGSGYFVCIRFPA